MKKGSRSAGDVRELRSFLAGFDRPGLRRALWCMRRAEARPAEINLAANQYYQVSTLMSASAVRAEYVRRGWKIPRPTRMERAER